MTDVVAVKVACPDCGNVNREARRMCKYHGGMCGGSGQVTKHLPAAHPTPTPDEGE